MLWDLSFSLSPASALKLGPHHHGPDDASSLGFLSLVSPLQPVLHLLAKGSFLQFILDHGTPYLKRFIGSFPLEQKSRLFCMASDLPAPFPDFFQHHATCSLNTLLILLDQTLLPGIPLSTHPTKMGKTGTEDRRHKGPIVISPPCTPVSLVLLPGGSLCSLCVLPEILCTNTRTCVCESTYIVHTNCSITYTFCSLSTVCLSPIDFKLLFFLPLTQPLCLEQCLEHSKCSINFYC